MELLKKLKTTKIPQIEADESSLKYMEDSNLINVVNKGLAELYRIQPKNPITFLSNYLLNESYSRKLLSKIDYELKVKQETEQKIKKEEEYLQKLAEEQQQKDKIQQDKIDKLKELITSTDDFERDLNEICEQLKEIIGATGVYISSYELKRKQVESIDEDENAHIDPDNIKVLRFIHWNKDHDFLHGKYIEPKKGVTYQLFLAPGEGGEDEEGEEGGEQNAEANNENAEGDNKNEGEENDNEEGEETDANNKKKEEIIKNIIINDVLLNNKIIFYREPRLGAYMAFNISYQSSLNYNSLISAITNLEEYNTKVENREKLKAERGEDKENSKEEEEEEEEENEGEGNNEEKEVDDLKKPIKLEDFEKEQKILILSIDTIGQDRTFSDSEKELLNEFAKLIRDSMQNLEKTLLEKDRDLRMDYNKVEKQLVEDWPDDKIYTEKENAMRDYLNSDEYISKNITEDAEKTIEENFGRANSIMNTVYNTEFINNLNMFEKFEFVQYENIFQNIFYFCKIEPNEINEPETNKLSWKLAKTKWCSLFEILKEYNPFGAKPDKIKGIFKGNRILENLQPYMEEDKIEEITKYSFSLIRIIDYIVSILKVRKDDIVYRHTTQRQKRKERQDIIKANEKLDKERKRALDKAEAEYYGKKPPGDNEEEEKEDDDKEEGEGEGGEGEEKEKKEEAKNEESEDSDKTEEDPDDDDDEDKEEKEAKGDENKEEGGDAEGGAAKKNEEKKEELEPFNVEEFLNMYDQEHPKTPVPDEVELDVDEDFDIGDGEGEGENGEEEEGEEGDNNDEKDEKSN